MFVEARHLRECPARSGPLIRNYRRVGSGIGAPHIGFIVAGWMKAAGVKNYAGDGRSAHALRHTALTELAEATGDAFLVQELAGWSSPATAANYVRRASTERLREAMAKRDAVDQPDQGGPGAVRPCPGPGQNLREGSDMVKCIRTTRADCESAVHPDDLARRRRLSGYAKLSPDEEEVVGHD